jgi:Fur family transcriptional regulator, zinc uptake regulator
MPRTLVPNHQKILQILHTAGVPMTAYEILEAVRHDGITAPPTVYRALSRLIENGMVHRLESMNAYVVCSDHGHGDAPALFTICRDCGHVDELAEAGLVRQLQANATRHGFHVETGTIELRGRCSCCARG